MTRPSRIVLDALVVRENPTGVALGILELLREMAAAPADLEFVVAATEPAAFAFLEDRPGWTVRPCPAARGGAWRKAWFTQTGLPRLCRETGADLLHSLQFLTPLRAPCPVIATVHDLAWRSHPRTVPAARRAYYRALVPPGLRRAALIAANSQATAAEIAAQFPALADRVRVTPHGTPRWALAAGPRRGPPPEGAGYLLFTGALEPRKNLPRLLDAYEILLAEAAGPAPDLVLAGPPGWSGRELARRLARPGLRGRVRLAGYVPQDGMPGLLAGATALVFPSLHEGFGLPVLEAMALGVPVLTADRGATAEVAGEAALLVDPLDTAALARGLHRLVFEPGLADDLAARGPERARRWSWRATAAATLAMYTEILGPSGDK